MIIEIDNPNFNYNCLIITKEDKFYYDDINNEYFTIGNGNKAFFNKNGNLHNVNGPAIFPINKKNIQFYGYYLNDVFCSKMFFAENTNHLICKRCRDFCKQSCF